MKNWIKNRMNKQSQAQKQRPKLIFLFPGNASSGLQWIGAHVTLTNLAAMGFDTGIRHSRGCNLYGVRNRCLSLKKSQVKQKAFEDTPYADYDRIVWVDSDNHISAEKVMKLYNHDVDIVAAWYRQYSSGPLNGDNLVACGKRTIEYFCEEDKKLMHIPLKQHAFHPYRVKEMATLPRDEKGLIEVDYAGMGLMLIKKRVMDALDYPWFKSWVYEWEENGVKMAEMVTDDDGFLIRAKEAGFKIFVDPEVRLDHEKPVMV
jgi:hypothetical protein